MIDYSQKNHFEKKENRYKEQLLFSPYKHVIEEVKIIAGELKKRNCTHVVDFGCGNGRLTIPLLQMGVDVTAVDISRTSLNELSRVVTKMNLKKGHLSIAPEIPQKKWNAVVGCDILHHVPLSTTLKMIRGNLSDENGLIVFSEPNIWNMAWAIFVTLNREWNVEKGMLHCSYFNFLNVLKNENFKNVSLYGYGLLPPVFFNTFPLLQKINYFLGNIPLIKLFAYRYIITAEANFL